MQQAARKAKAKERNQKVTQRQQQIPKVEEDLVSGPEELRLPTGTTTTPQTPPEPKANPKPKKATEPQVKKNLPEAKAIVEIGKVGSKYENGIQDVDTALEVAQLLGITARISKLWICSKERTERGKRLWCFQT